MAEQTLHNVSTKRIHDELNALWASNSSDEGAIIRAQTHNLIVYCADEVSAQETTNHIMMLTAERPGRVIVIDVENGRTKPPEAWVSTYCRKVGNQQICGEFITLTTGYADKFDHFSTILSLLLPDLPTYLWWLGVPEPDDRLFVSLSEKAERVIVDSEKFSNALQILSSLDSCRQRKSLGDLNWARITGWRRQLAAIWDSPLLAEQLAFIHEVSITTRGSNITTAGASGLLLVGWFAEALGWSLTNVVTGDASITLDYTSAGSKDTLVQLGHDLAEVDTGIEIAAIDISFGRITGGQSAVLRLREQNEMIEVDISGLDGVALQYSQRFDRISDPKLLADELDTGFDDDYDNALTGLFKILSLIRQNDQGKQL